MLAQAQDDVGLIYFLIYSNKVPMVGAMHLSLDDGWLVSIFMNYIYNFRTLEFLFYHFPGGGVFEFGNNVFLKRSIFLLRV